MSARKPAGASGAGAAAGSKSRAGARGKKGEEPPVLEAPVPPEKTEDELWEEELAATMTDLSALSDTTALPAPAPSPSASALWSMRREDVHAFCFPAGEQHPRSRGRLWILATQGPLVRLHTYTACLCQGCKERVRERRKEDAYAARVYAGEPFGSDNVPRRSQSAMAKQGGSEATGSAAASSSVAPAAAHPAMPALSGVGDLMRVTSPTGTVSLPLFASPSTAALDTTLSAATLFATQQLPSSSSPSPSPSELLPPLCRSCTHHAHSTAHILGGKGGRHVLSALEINELARRVDEEDLLKAYNRFGLSATQASRGATRLTQEEEREFLSKLDADKVAAARSNYTPAQLDVLLSQIAPSPSSSSPSPNSSSSPSFDFYTLRSMVLGERSRKIGRLGEMYPDAGTKGGSEFGFAEGQKRQVGKKSALPSEANRRREEEAKESGAAGASPPTSVNGVQWPGESMLSYALLARKFSPHQSDVLRSRLLHKHTHQVVELGSRGRDHPSVQLSVAIMRNTHLSDRNEGWK